MTPSKNRPNATNSAEPCTERLRAPVADEVRHPPDESVDQQAEAVAAGPTSAQAYAHVAQSSGDVLDREDEADRPS